MDTQNATLDSVEPYSIPPVEILYSRKRNGKLYMKHLNAISGWIESRIPFKHQRPYSGARMAVDIGPLDTHFSRCGSSMVLPIREPSLGGILLISRLISRKGIQLIIMHYLCVKRYLLSISLLDPFKWVRSTVVMKDIQYQFCFGLFSLY